MYESRNKCYKAGTVKDKVALTVDEAQQAVSS